MLLARSLSVGRSLSVLPDLFTCSVQYDQEDFNNVSCFYRRGCTYSYLRFIAGSVVKRV
jgi:hypothetical protein